jgi:hypothetical protein
MKARALPLVIITTTLAFIAATTQSATITVNTEDNTDFSAGKTNLVLAINSLSNGDTIAFNIPGSGVHYLNTPVDGYPLITKHSVTINGYTQPGASPNSNPIHAANNAQIKICLTSTNGNCLSMGNSVAAFTGLSYNNLGFGDDEMAILGIFRATNFVLRGVAILSTPTGDGNGVSGGDIKSIAFCADSLEVGGENAGNWRISGCWFGIDPTTRNVAYLDDGVTLAIPAISIAAYRTRNNDGSNVRYPQPGTIGVAAGAANPRADFNVIFTGYGFDSEGLNFRVSGNFFNVLPDGVTNPDISQLNGGAQKGDGYLEIGRSYDNILIGTDGDGVNDADEGNVFGGCDTPNFAMVDLYSSSSGTNFIFSGNYFGVGVDGTTRFTNSAVMVDSFNGNAQVQFGSDFNGVSDALEGNLMCNYTNFLHTVFDGGSGAMNPGIRMSFRGNRTINNEILPYSYASGFGGRLVNFTNYSGRFMSTNADIIPAIASNSTAADIIGTCASTNGTAYTNISIDVYVADLEGWTNGQDQALFELTDNSTYTNGFAQGRAYLGTFVDNGPLDRDPAVGKFNFNASALGIIAGTPITVTANYSQDPPGTTHGRTHTSNFSTPVNLRAALRIASISRSGNTVTITWSGGSAPYTLQKASSINGPWNNQATGLSGTSTTDPGASGPQAFYRILGN